MDPPRGSVRVVLTEFLPLALWFVVFTRLDALTGRDAGAATANALSLQAVERALHLDVEVSVNAWLAGHAVLSRLAVGVYRLYYPVVAGVLIWIFIRHAEVYRRVRRTMVAMMALALLVYWTVPLSPPRFALPGAVDVVARHDFVDQSSWTHPSHYTAMPSMHVGWALWCAYAACSALRPTHPRRARLVWSFPLLMVLVVLGTGNHYVLDVAGSAVLVTAAALLGHAVTDRLRPPHPVRRER
ncbi:phosphatase PAP2 family protein [Actinoplanes sp. HUAS TT8]|uniref:phosphatase PAP2 family protein n=1 Tax=Actinoplanes sp. HUAS TT8 TaxID=3447453 RepID=UPI003F5252EA